MILNQIKMKTMGNTKSNWQVSYRTLFCQSDIRLLLQMEYTTHSLYKSFDFAYIYEKWIEEHGFYNGYSNDLSALYDVQDYVFSNDSSSTVLSNKSIAHDETNKSCQKKHHFQLSKHTYPKLGAPTHFLYQFQLFKSSKKRKIPKKVIFTVKIEWWQDTAYSM